MSFETEKTILFKDILRGDRAAYEEMRRLINDKPLYKALFCNLFSQSKADLSHIVIDAVYDLLKYRSSDFYLLWQYSPALKTFLRKTSDPDLKLQFANSLVAGAEGIVWPREAPFKLLGHARHVYLTLKLEVPCQLDKTTLDEKIAVVEKKVAEQLPVRDSNDSRINTLLNYFPTIEPISRRKRKRAPGDSGSLPNTKSQLTASSEGDTQPVSQLSPVC